MIVLQNAPPVPDQPPAVPPGPEATLPGPAPVGDNNLFIPGAQSPQRLLDAAKSQQAELLRQLRGLEGRREDVLDEINSSGTSEAALPALQGRLAELDARISALDAQVAGADALVVQRTAIPGAVPPRNENVSNGPPDELIAIPIVFMIFVLFPLAIGYARRMWKRGATVIAPVPKEVRDRLDQMGDAVETMALEVERIGEGQRFLTRVMTESRRELGAGGMQPIPVPRPAEASPVQREREENWR